MSAKAPGPSQLSAAPSPSLLGFTTASINAFMGKVWQGFRPLEAVDLVVPSLASQSSNHEARDHVARQRIAVQRARDSLKFAQDETAFRIDQHRRDIRYAAGDKILIHRDHLIPIGDHRRLLKTQDLFSGPFNVLGMVGDTAVRISLPSTYKQHNVFHVSGARPWTSNPDEPDPMPRPDLESEDGTYSVGSIVKPRVRNSKREWLVSWKGWNRAYNSWERMDSFCSDGTVTDALRRFERARTGSDAALEFALHNQAVETEYADGPAGEERHAADGFDISNVCNRLRIIVPSCCPDRCASHSPPEDEPSDVSEFEKDD